MIGWNSIHLIIAYNELSSASGITAWITMSESGGNF
jgi:hypothetical protein